MLCGLSLRPCCGYSLQTRPSVNGLSLHANIAIPAHRRAQLERVMRCPARGAGALERRTADDHGDLMYMVPRPCSDGTTGIKLSPLELLEKLAVIVPLPRVHLVRYGGCLAPREQTPSHPMFCDEIPRIFLTVLPSYAAVAIAPGLCEQCLPYEKLPTSSPPGSAWTIFKLLV